MPDLREFIVAPRLLQEQLRNFSEEIQKIYKEKMKALNSRGVSQFIPFLPATIIPYLPSIKDKSAQDVNGYLKLDIVMEFLRNIETQYVKYFQKCLSEKKDLNDPGKAVVEFYLKKEIEKEMDNLAREVIQSSQLNSLDGKELMRETKVRKALVGKQQKFGSAIGEMVNLYREGEEKSKKIMGMQVRSEENFYAMVDRLFNEKLKETTVYNSDPKSNPPLSPGNEDPIIIMAHASTAPFLETLYRQKLQSLAGKELNKGLVFEANYGVVAGDKFSAEAFQAAMANYADGKLSHILIFAGNAAAVKDAEQYIRDNFKDSRIQFFSMVKGYSPQLINLSNKGNSDDYSSCGNPLSSEDGGLLDRTVKEFLEQLTVATAKLEDLEKRLSEKGNDDVKALTREIKTELNKTESSLRKNVTLETAQNIMENLSGRLSSIRDKPKNIKTINKNNSFKNWFENLCETVKFHCRKLMKISILGSNTEKTLDDVHKLINPRKNLSFRKNYADTHDGFSDIFSPDSPKTKPVPIATGPDKPKK